MKAIWNFCTKNDLHLTCITWVWGYDQAKKKKCLPTWTEVQNIKSHSLYVGLAVSRIKKNYNCNENCDMCPWEKHIDGQLGDVSMYCTSKTECPFSRPLAVSLSYKQMNIVVKFEIYSCFNFKGWFVCFETWWGSHIAVILNFVLKQLLLRNWFQMFTLSQWPCQIFTISM